MQPVPNSIKIKLKFLFNIKPVWASGCTTQTGFRNMNPVQTELSENRVKPNLKPDGTTGFKLYHELRKKTILIIKSIFLIKHLEKKTIFSS